MTQHRNKQSDLDKVAFIYTLFNQIKYLTEFKNLVLKRKLSNRVLEITTNSAIQLKIFVLEKRAGLILM